ncbi:MAG: inositol monophosphatase family protein [Candidatus Heimdallarchaeota archaeon]
MFGKTEFIRLCQAISNDIIELLITSRKKGEALDQEVGLGADGEPAHLIDMLAEEKAIERIKQAEFGGSIIAEEQGKIQLGKSGYTIWLDPIDGTKNAYRNFPYYALSIALYHKMTFKSGYIRNLANGDEFLAHAKVATLNGKHLKTTTRPLKNIGIITIRPRSEKGFSFLHFLQKKVQFIRILGAAALDMAYIASGAVDAFLDLDRGLKSVDYAAAQPLLEFAGGVMSDLRGQPILVHENLTLKSQILAANTLQLHSKLYGLLQKFGYTNGPE